MCHCFRRPYVLTYVFSGILDTKTSTRHLIRKMRVWLILRVRDVTWLKFVANKTPLRFEAYIGDRVFLTFLMSFSKL